MTDKTEAEAIAEKATPTFRPSMAGSLRLSTKQHRRLMALMRAAVQSAVDAHPEYFVHLRVKAMRESVAKRIVGAVKASSAASGGPGPRLTVRDGSLARGRQRRQITAPPSVPRRPLTRET